MSEEILGEGRHLRLLRRGRWEFVERVGVEGIVVILAVTDADEVVCVEQERAAVGARVIDLPAGLVEDESFEAAARRELEEETGFVAQRLERLAEATPSPGLSAEVVTFYRAHGLARVGPGGGDASERIEVHLVPRAGMEAWLQERIARGVLVDAKLYAGLYLAGQ
ncbi:MAG: NUDIX hydrolase [Planctomycetota bacterium]|jgi:ADP-ribose pyrophosphatase